MTAQATFLDFADEPEPIDDPDDGINDLIERFGATNVSVANHVDGRGTYWLAMGTIPIGKGKMLLSAIERTKADALRKLHKQFADKSTR
jgi:hypothetical protein